MPRCIARTAKNKKCAFFGIYPDNKCIKHTCHKQICSHILKDQNGEERCCKNKAEEDGKCRFHSENHTLIQKNYNILTFDFEEEYNELAKYISQSLDTIHNMDTSNMSQIVSSYLMKKETFIKYNNFITNTFKEYCNLLDQVYEHPVISDSDIHYAIPFRITDHYVLSFEKTFLLNLRNLFVHYIVNINQILCSARFHVYYINNIMNNQKVFLAFLIYLSDSLSDLNIDIDDSIKNVLIKLITFISDDEDQNQYYNFPRSLSYIQIDELKQSLKI